jgi:hypothetical protein
MASMMWPASDKSVDVDGRSPAIVLISGSRSFTSVRIGAVRLAAIRGVPVHRSPPAPLRLTSIPRSRRKVNADDDGRPDREDQVAYCRTERKQHDFAGHDQIVRPFDPGLRGLPIGRSLRVTARPSGSRGCSAFRVCV